jgi:hypothetical protein
LLREKDGEEKLGSTNGVGLLSIQEQEEDLGDFGISEEQGEDEGYEYYVYETSEYEEEGAGSEDEEGERSRSTSGSSSASGNASSRGSRKGSTAGSGVEVEPHAATKEDGD